MLCLKKKLGTLLLMAVSLGSYAQKSAELQLLNRLPLYRQDELLVLTRTAIEHKLGKLKKGSFVQFVHQGKVLPAQFDDLNKDGLWDEVALLQSFKPNQTLVLKLSQTDKRLSVATVRAHARHRRKLADESFGADLLKDSVPKGQQPTDFAKHALPPFLTEGPAWENDKVGFRLYFDVRNGKDIWGKTTAAMVLDSVGVNPKHNYHEQAAWGMDVLKVGPSLGAGALALKTTYQGRDTLIRLGGLNMGKIVYEKVSDGPLRALIRLHYPEWNALPGQAPIRLTEEISIWGGQYFYESKVIAYHLPAASQLVTGIVNLKSKSVTERNQPDLAYLFTYDTQSENKDNLGMAILARPTDRPVFSRTPNELTDIRNTYTVQLALVNGKPVKFRFVAAWEKIAEMFRSSQAFENYLAGQAKSFSSPIAMK